MEIEQYAINLDDCMLMSKATYLDTKVSTDINPGKQMVIHFRKTNKQSHSLHPVI